MLIERGLKGMIGKGRRTESAAGGHCAWLRIFWLG
jgi:hypothetical protein